MTGSTTRRDLLAGGGGALAALAVASGRASAQDVAEVPGVSADVLAQAERVLDVSYTDAEREQMLGGVVDQLDTIRALRALDKPNALAPAHVFRPWAGFAEPTLRHEGRVSGPTEPVTAGPGDADDIAFAPAHRQAAWLRSGAISSVGLTELYLDRLAQHAPGLACMVTVTADRARAEAAAADAALAAGEDRGPLHGLPYVLKDLFDAAGAPTTWGASFRSDVAPAATDSHVAAKLREAGAVLLGKSTCGALAYGDIWFGGVTRNPFSPQEGSSGSSAGSASAAAAGLCSFAIGTETLGSIVSPSHRCGTAGLRPTFGRVGRSGGMALCWSLDKIGPLARSVADTALVLNALVGADPADPSNLDTGFGVDLDEDVRGLSVGFDPAWYEGAAPADLAARDALIDAGAVLVERRMPSQPGGQLVLALIVEAAAAFEDMTLSDLDDQLRWQEDPAWPNAFRTVRFVSAIDYVQIDRIRRRVMAETHEAFAGLDAIAGPNFAGGMLTTTNFTGHPQLAFRAGFIETPPRSLFGAVSDPDAAPVRVPYASSLWAPLFREDVLVRLGAAIERRLGVAEERPPL